MDVGLTTLREEDITKHYSMALSLLTRTTVLVADEGKSKTPLAGTRRRFVSTVSTGGARRTVEIKTLASIDAVTPDDQLLSSVQHNIVYRLRRGFAVGLAVRDLYAKQTELEDLAEENKSSALGGDRAGAFHKLTSSSSFDLYGNIRGLI